MEFFSSFGFVSAILYLHLLCTSAKRYILEEPNGGVVKEGDGKLLFVTRFRKLWIKDPHDTLWTDSSQNPRLSSPKRCRRKTSYCLRLQANNFERLILESATKQLIERLHKKLGGLLNDLRQDLFEYKGVVEKTSDFTTLDKSQDITASCLPQLVTGLNQLNCYNAAKISWELHEVGNSYPLQFIRNNHQGLLLQLGNLEYMSMNARSKLAYLYESLQTDNIPQISILWPQDERSATLLKLSHFIYEAPERHPMFHVLYSGDFKDSIANLLDNGHHSLSILGPFAHVHTLIQIAAHKTPFNNHFPTATYSSNRSSVRLVPRDFLRGSPTFETLLVEAGKGKRLTVLKGKPYFRISNSGLYRHKKPPRRYDTSIVFGSGLDLDLGVKIHSIRRRLGDLLKLMINEYKHAIMAALVAGSEVQALYLQPLVDPNDRVLFKLSLSALGSAISELSESLKLIPVKLMLPLLSTRAFHLTYEKDMIKALREHISPRSTVTIEKIGFSEEKQQFITHYTKSGPRRQRPDLK